ncbi:NTF2 fold immunity protein, partial [Escherichia coli]
KSIHTWLRFGEIMRGSLRAKLPYEVAGGVFIIEINKKNGCVLNFLHSK